MFIDINKIEPEGVRIDSQLNLPDLGMEGREPITVLSAHLSGWVRKGEGRPELEARLEARLKVVCSRCLEPLEEVVTSSFFLILDTGSGSGEEAPGSDEDQEVCFYPAEKGMVNLGEIATEQIYLNRNCKPVCSPACRGLCPGCGVDRNQAECRCAGEEIDPRLAPLLKLRKS